MLYKTNSEWSFGERWDAPFNSAVPRWIEHLLSFTSCKILYHCTHGHSLLYSMRLLENDKFPNLQSGKQYAYLEAYAGNTERRCSGEQSPLTFLKKSILKKKHETYQFHKWAIQICSSDLSGTPPGAKGGPLDADLTVMWCLKPLIFRGFCPLDPTKGPKTSLWMLIWP